MCTILITAVLITAILMIYFGKKSEGFVSKPTATEINQFTDEMIENHEYFHSTLYEAKEKMPWLDAITFEDARELSRRNNFTAVEIAKLFG